jgi:hypothetical protein
MSGLCKIEMSAFSIFGVSNIRGQCKNLLPLYDQIFFSIRRYSGHFLPGLPQIIGNLLAKKSICTAAIFHPEPGFQAQSHLS